MYISGNVLVVVGSIHDIGFSIYISSRSVDFFSAIFFGVVRFLFVFSAHGVGVNQAAKSDVDFSYASIHEFSVEERAHVGYAKRVDSLRACFFARFQDIENIQTGHI